jgi:hypothetical protein
VPCKCHHVVPECTEHALDLTRVAATGKHRRVRFARPPSD